ncbi:penicillin amidase [uncultured bacterium]|nr:penicillin amidase [uncultured bacterium]
MKRGLRYLALFLALVLVLIGAGFLYLQQSQAILDGQVVLHDLSAPVNVSTDEHGIPLIQATNRLDAVRTLGYLTAQDRLFQMDLMRRKNAGRLSELFGSMALENDIRARTYGFHRVAKQIVEQLPKEHQVYLQAYSAGVNEYIASTTVLPFEFTVLGYQPEPWQMEDSLLVALGMFDMLMSRTEKEERMLTVMAKTLPPDVMAFLTPTTDEYTEYLQHHKSSVDVKIPVASLANLFQSPLANAVQLQDFFIGSNAWAISGNKTQDGRAIVANDMHLGLSVPSIWYRYEMKIGTEHSAGVMLPGLPLLIAGSNDKIAWGNTNLTGDSLDLVLLDINPNNANEYKVGDHWQAFETIKENIIVKGEDNRELLVKQTLWGAVSNQPLLNQSVAIHWTALDANAVNLGLLDLENAQNLQQATDILHRAGNPQLNVLLADSQGQIAWTMTGKIPKRIGFDGSISQSWANGQIGWQGYIAETEIPQQLNTDNVLVSANDRRFDEHLPYVIGRQFANGYRAYRIKQRLNELKTINEQSAFELQLDTETEFYRFYQQLALSVLSDEKIKQQPELTEIRAYLQAWQGKAESNSLGFPLLVQFRKQLAQTVFNPFLTASQKADKNFHYSWSYVDTPLKALLTEKPAALLPDKHYADWNTFILAELKNSVTKLKAKYPDKSLSEITWGMVNKANIQHPFSKALPMLSDWLNMPKDELAGCDACVRAMSSSFGASERMVISPAHLKDGILHIPAGQSAHPLSPYYQDQQFYWVHGLPLPLLAGTPEHHLIFIPAN